LAQRRYLRVDPDNRLVADSLEADWNHKLRALTEAHEEYARRHDQDARVLTDDQRATILALASDFPRLWRDPVTRDRERKRMVRLRRGCHLNRDHQLTLQIRFKVAPTRRSISATIAILEEVVHRGVIVIDQLLNNHTVADRRHPE
jgi:hypothetical protein